MVADKGYLPAEMITTFAEETSYRTYIPSRDSQLARRASGPTSRPNNATRPMRTGDGLAADVVSDCNDRAANSVERSFACVCETGGARRTWIGGDLQLASRRSCRHGPQLGTPDVQTVRNGDAARIAEGGGRVGGRECTQLALIAVRARPEALTGRQTHRHGPAVLRPAWRPAADWRRDHRNSSFSTGC